MTDDAIAELARLIYEADPFQEGGEWVDGFQVSPGGPISWEQACARDAEFADSPEMSRITGMLPITKSALDIARRIHAAGWRRPPDERIKQICAALVEAGARALACPPGAPGEWAALSDEERAKVVAQLQEQGWTRDESGVVINTKISPRRPGPITDAQVEAAAAVLASSPLITTGPILPYDWTRLARAVLEAAAVPAAPNSKESQ